MMSAIPPDDNRPAPLNSSTSIPTGAVQIERLYPGIALLSILAFTAAGAVLGFAGIADMEVESSTAVMVYVALGITGVTEPLLARYVVLPPMERSGASRFSAVLLGYSLVMPGSVYALLGGILAGAGWPALPLGAIAIYGWAFIWMYTREWPEEVASTSDHVE